MSIFDEPFASRRRSVEDDFIADAYSSASSETSSLKKRKESSAELAARRREFDREAKDDESMQEELDQFIELQRKADEDGKFTKSEERDAKDAFLDKKFGLSEEATLGDVEDLKTEIPSGLEANFRLLPLRGDAVSEDSIELDTDLRPIWNKRLKIPSTIGKTVGMNLRIKTVEDEIDDPELEWDFDKWSDNAP